MANSESEIAVIVKVMDPPNTNPQDEGLDDSETDSDDSDSEYEDESLNARFGCTSKRRSGLRKRRVGGLTRDVRFPRNHWRRRLVTCISGVRTIYRQGLFRCCGMGKRVGGYVRQGRGSRGLL